VPKAVVVPIRREVLISDSGELVVEVAYGLWVSSAFCGGTPEEALLSALRILRAKTATLFLVPRRKPDLHPVSVMKSRSGRGTQPSEVLDWPRQLDGFSDETFSQRKT
jgi:hypothetical protein